MAAPTPYRTLTPAQRIALVTHDISQHRDSREGYISRIVARGGGFRPDKLRRWPPEQLAREVVRHNLETPHDELGLMVALYVDLEPAIQVAFLDATGVRHEGGSIPEDTQPPFASADVIRQAATDLVSQHGADGLRYLRTIALYNGDAWPGLAEHLAAQPETTNG